MPKAAPSTRSAGNVNLTFNLVNIAVTLYTGTVSQHGLTRKEFHPVPVMEADGVTQKTIEVTRDDGTKETLPVVEDHPVGRGLIDKITGDLIADQSNVVRKILTEYGPVYVEDHEIEDLFSITPDSVVVKKFQPLFLFHQGHYVPKTLQHVQPRVTGTGRKKGPDPVATKLLLTMLKGMREESSLAVVDITTRGIPKPGILLPDGTLWHIWHTDALREQRELPEPSASLPVVDAEVTMFRTLIKTMWSEEPLDLSDERSALIQAFADEKAALGDFGKPKEVEVTAPAPAAAPDLMALLAASVEQAKEAS